MGLDRSIPYTKNQQSILQLCPDIKGKSLLNVGFNSIIPSTGIEAKHWWVRLFQDVGVERFAILELFQQNIAFINKYFGQRDFPMEVRWGDARHIRQYYKIKEFDIVLWWHGPEHLVELEIEPTLFMLRSVAKDWLVVGCPNGYLEQDEVYGNPHETHRSHKEESFYRDHLEYTTTVVKWNGMEHLTAIKDLQHG